MKKLILLLCLLSSICFAQTSDSDLKEAIKKIEKERLKQKEELDRLLAQQKNNEAEFLRTLKSDREKLNEKILAIEIEPPIANNRISFVLGIGSAFVLDQLYQNPAINLNNNNVMLEKAQHLKTNLTFGIVYTPYLYKITYKDGKSETMPKGISFATFINPIALTKATENQSFFNMTDFGVGIGYKFAGSIMVMGTFEFLGVRQPKNWFIEEYQNNNRQYSVNGSPQLSFDVNDNNVFQSKIATTIGFKVCYTFDIVKNFKKSSD